MSGDVKPLRVDWAQVKGMTAQIALLATHERSHVFGIASKDSLPLPEDRKAVVNSVKKAYDALPGIAQFHAMAEFVGYS